MVFKKFDSNKFILAAIKLSPSSKRRRLRRKTYQNHKNGTKAMTLDMSRTTIGILNKTLLREQNKQYQYLLITTSDYASCKNRDIISTITNQLMCTTSQSFCIEIPDRCTQQYVGFCASYFQVSTFKSCAAVGKTTYMYTPATSGD